MIALLIVILAIWVIVAGLGLECASEAAQGKGRPLTRKTASRIVLWPIVLVSFLCCTVLLFLSHLPAAFMDAVRCPGVNLKLKMKIKEK